MEMEPQVPLEHESGFHLVSVVAEHGGSSVTNSLQDHAVPQQPVKKQTRQWAAWTHQEEENFFSALRQVGKNFEKITCRVQSKNKDQVRHYYYRLVRRMNKLLGPELWLDAKNSKDTNAAMLRWWSLLEKYSCKASKLHLKPRRFKLIVETLENQLLKDRKKTVRKRSSQGENCSLNIPTSVIVDQSRIPVHDSCPMKPVLVDSQNIQKFSTGKGSSVKRQVNIGINRNNYKADSSSAKSSKHRRKAVGGSTAAYKRWEKAAIAGVSLVADAAEHLERTSTDKEVEHNQDVAEQNGFDYGDKDAPSLPNNLQSSMKLKLQLFPVDENTRRALEMDNRNPYLELTLSTRKKIPSVLEHLNRKWGTSSVASGNLMLFPFSVQNVNMVSHRWTKDSTLNAGDVYALIGSPPVFRLRYGWFLDTAIEPVTSQVPFACSNEQTQRMNLVNEKILDSVSNPNPPSLHKYEKISDLHKDLLGSATKLSLATSSSVCTELIQQYSMPVGISGSSGHASASLLDAEGETAVIMEQDKHQGDSGTQKAAVLSAGEWADSLTNISIGDLLESSGNDEVDCVNSHWPRISGSLPQIPFSCDSFDDAIAAHIRKHEKRISCSPPLLSHASSIWDAEETCDAFSFQKNIFSEKVDAFSKSSLGTFGEIAQGSSAEPARETEELSDVDKALVDDDPVGHLTDKFESDGHTSDSSIRDLNGLTDIYWPDSLGPLDLDILPSSCRYHNDDLILSDSLGGLSRLIASSLDAFQNCSFFGSERKDTPTSTSTTATVQAGESACVSNVKMGH